MVSCQEKMVGGDHGDSVGQVVRDETAIRLRWQNTIKMFKTWQAVVGQSSNWYNYREIMEGGAR